MSTDTVDSDDEHAAEIITLTRMEEGEGWVARDERTGVASQGETREDALSMLDESLAGYRGAGEEPTDEELREMGVDPENDASGSLDDSEIFD